MIVWKLGNYIVGQQLCMKKNGITQLIERMIKKMVQNVKVLGIKVKNYL